ncbi:hypothetical protein Agub_g8913 [Astrephomene gubernaculifera]|uniref:Uncharacterized protein n=1 Tax=Astrephomene gubernaculifera TaxID=47775 RepID=A0AAD3DUB0_9CHLO|nr:hypothetical protein Agub_g8913 [Astrephomene gubernaculifera]
MFAKAECCYSFFVRICVVTPPLVAHRRTVPSTTRSSLYQRHTRVDILDKKAYIDIISEQMAALGIALLRGPKARWCQQTTSTTASAVRLAFHSNIAVESARAVNASAGDSLLSAYQRLLDGGALQPDASQASAVRMLQLLQDAVLQREETRCGSSSSGSSRSIPQNTPPPPSSAAANATTAAASPATTSSSSGGLVRGAYLWGSVGSGKTALMDLFVTTTQRRLHQRLQQQQLHNQDQQQQQPDSEGSNPSISTPSTTPSTTAVRGSPVLRAHFHEFMQGVHGRLHELQLARPRVVGRSRQGLPVYRYAEPEEDPLVTVAREYGSRIAVLCLDELHVTDVADAMILSRLFGSLLEDQGTTVVFTSNRAPLELYKGGLSRKYFEPFVRLVDEQMVVAHVSAGVDFRRRTNSGSSLDSCTTRAGAAAAAATAEQQQQSTALEASGGCSAAAGRSSSSSGEEGEKPAAAIMGGGGWFVGLDAEQRLRGIWQQRVGTVAAETGVAAAVGGQGGGVAVDSAVPPPPAAAAAVPSPGGSAVEVPLAYGRRLKVPYTAGDAAFFTFEQLCGPMGLRAGMDDGGALGAPDFLALCRRFRDVFLVGVPQLGPAQRDEARRLVTLLDVAYDNSCRLHVAAAVASDDIFAPLLQEARRQGINPRLGLPKSAAAATPAATTTTSKQQAGAAGVAAAGTVPSSSPSSFPPSSSSRSSAAAQLGDLSVPRAVLAEEVLMYHRAASRLAEMCPMAQ